MNILRPLSPHLPIYKPQLTSTFPIFHRISGAFLATIVFSFYLLCLKMGLICFTYENFYGFFFYSSKLILISVEITALALSYHLYNGLRHLFLDHGIYIMRKNEIKSKRKFICESQMDLLFLIFFCILSLIFYLLFKHLILKKADADADSVQFFFVLGQMCFLLTLEYDGYEAKERRRLQGLVLITNLCTHLCYLYLIGIDSIVLLMVILLCISFFFLLSSEVLTSLVLLLYLQNESLAQWGIHLAFQLLWYFLVSVFINARGVTIHKKRKIFFLVLQLFILSISGRYIYLKNFLDDSTKLAVLLSGAFLIYFNMKSRPTEEFHKGFFLYVFVGLLLSVLMFLSTDDSEQRKLILDGLLLFLFFQIFPLCIYFFLRWKGRLSEFHIIIPIYSIGIMLFLSKLSHFNEFHTWFEGMAQLFSLLVIWKLLFEKESLDFTRRTNKEASERTK